MSEHFESITEALIACVKASGGSKTVGAAIWPDVAPDQAQHKLLNALDDSRPEKIAPSQMMMILRLARAKGYHAGIEFICSVLGYTTPSPVQPKDEEADLMRQFNSSVEAMQQMMSRLAQLRGDGK